MQKILVAAALALSFAGCYNPNIGNGELACAAGNVCPNGFVCASDNRCYRPNTGPTTDDAGPDFAGVDLFGVDLFQVKLPLKSACTTDADCDTGHCADGICCMTACDQACFSCKQVGNEGSCSPLNQGDSPLAGHLSCAAQAQSTCGRDGTCDGVGSCARWNDVVCKPAGCDSTTNKAHAASKCDGTGTCVDATAVTCAPFLCKADHSACISTCGGATDCVSPAPCVGGSCGTKATGSACTMGTQCTSGFCSDSFCCDTACTGQCSACDVAGKQGMCSQVTGAVHGGRTACSGTAPCTGTCSTSLTSCTVAAVSCRTQSCTGSTKTAAATCVSSGCPAVSTSSCAPYICNPGGTDCRTNCSGDTDCTSGNYCLSNVCTVKRGNGSTCTTTNECASGICAGGRCCGTACAGACATCNSGTCAGAADGTQAASCNPYLCDGSSLNCPTSCATNADCFSGFICNPSGKCSSPLSNGSGCANNSQCASGICPATDGVCCDAACNDGPCQTCGSGTCTITGAPGPNRAACPAGVNDVSNNCGGSCAGSATCSFPGNTVACNVPPTPTPGGCNGAGTCVAGTCFSGDTPVVTADGLRPISSITVGTLVQSRDQVTGATSFQKVSAVEVRTVSDLAELTLSDGKHIETTSEHPFFVVGAGWVMTYELVPGDKLLQPDGNTVTVQGLASMAPKSLPLASGIAPTSTVYNLVVLPHDSFYVGESQVLVHSCHSVNGFVARHQ